MGAEQRTGKRILSLLAATLFSLLSVAQTQEPTEAITPTIVPNSKSDSIERRTTAYPVNDSEDKDSSTFFNHLYYLSFSGGDSHSYRNLGSVNPFLNADNSSKQPGFIVFDPLLRFPIRRSDSNHSYIAYLKGSKLEQVFCAGFNQRIFKRFVLEGGFRTINSPGFFINQQNKILNYQGSLSFQSRSNIYKAKVEFLPATISQQVNGGIISDSLFRALGNNEGKSINVNLPTAAIKLRHKDLIFYQDYEPNGDSASAIHWFINHNLNYYSTSYIYNSQTADTAFYHTIVYDSTVTSDSLHYYSISNYITPGIKYKTGRGELKVNLIGGEEHFRYHTFDSTLESDILMAGFEIGFQSNQVNSGIKSIYKKSDVYDPAWEVKVYFHLIPHSAHIRAEAEAKYLREYPSVISGHYVSNHFYWTNQFNNPETQSLKLKLLSNDGIWELSGSAYNRKGFLYYNESALPEQFNKSFSVFQEKIKINFPFLKKWYIYSDVCFSQSGNENIYRVPDIYGYAAVYHERKIFKNAMKISIGAGCHYFSSYKANNLMPATSQLYIQNDVSIGGYPYADFFINFRIKTVNFFIKLENINQGMSSAENFYMPHQPSPGRTLKVGLFWTFMEDQPIKR